MASSNKNIILQTFCYADVFDYPLTLSQLHFFAISSYPVSLISISEALYHLKKQVSFEDNFYSLKGRQKLFELRKKREKESQQKIKTATKIACILSYVPTIKLIGISGGLAMKNTDKKDDIDIFLIVEKNTVWISRLLVLFVFQIFGRRRGRRDKDAENKLCLNMLLDESALAFLGEKQNLYVAHEIIQLHVLYEQDHIYKQFLQKNVWIKQYLYNGYTSRLGNSVYNTSQRALSGFVWLFRFGNIFAKQLQLWYMKERSGKEIIADTLLAFHPNDYTDVILQKYYQRINRYEKI